MAIVQRGVGPVSDRTRLIVSRELLESLVEDSDCRFDHHGGCQEHGYLSLGWGEKCPQFELRELLADDQEARDTAKRAVCEYLLSVNRSHNGAFIPPMAINWLGDGLVDAVTANG